MFRRVEARQLLANPACLRRREGFVDRRRLMGIEVVQDHPDYLSIGRALIDEPFHRRGKVLPRAPLGDREVTPTRLRFAAPEEMGRAMALVFIV